MAMNGKRWEMVGTEQPLGTGPEGSPSSNPKSGQFQLMGDNVSMSHTSIQSPSSNPPQGSYQIIGSETPMNRTPVKGWGNAAHLVMSDRAILQSKTAAGGAGKKKK